MPEGRKSEMTIRTELVQAMLEARIEALVQAWRVPFGMEEVPAGEYRRRWSAMTIEQRQLEIARLGMRQVESLLLGG